MFGHWIWIRPDIRLMPSPITWSDRAFSTWFFSRFWAWGKISWKYEPFLAFDYCIKMNLRFNLSSPTIPSRSKACSDWLTNSYKKKSLRLIKAFQYFFKMCYDYVTKLLIIKICPRDSSFIHNNLKMINKGKMVGHQVG